MEGWELERVSRSSSHSPGRQDGATAIRVRENADYWKGLEFDQAFHVRWQ